MSYNILLAVVFVILSVYVVVNYRKLFVSDEPRQDLPPNDQPEQKPELINDTTGSIELIEKTKVKKPSAKKASKKVVKKKTRRREL